MGERQEDEGWSGKQRAALVLLGVLIALTAPFVVAAVTDMYTATSGITYNATDGPEVTLNEDLETNAQHPFDDAQTFNLTPHGTIASDGPTELSISGIEATETSLSGIRTNGNTIVVDFEGKQRVELANDVDSLSFRDMALDDGTVDFTYAGTDGTTTTVTVHDLSANTNVKAVDASTGERLAHGQTDASGEITLSLPNSQHDVLLQTSDGGPEYSNESPQNNGQVGDVETDLNVTVTDPDGTETSAAIKWNGSEIATETFSNGSGEINATVSDLEPGQYQWTVEATDGFGQTTSETYTFDVSSEGPPQLSNEDPQNGATIDDSDVELGINVSDPDNQDVDVVINHDGSEVHTETVQGDGRVTTSVSGLEGGSHEWTVEATDEFGQTTTETFTYGVPDTLYVYNESSPDSLIDSSTEVTVQIFGDDDEVFERSTTDGTIGLSGLPADQRLVIQADAEGYHSRRIVIDSLIDQQEIWLLPESAESVEVRFSLEDHTGRFDEERSYLYVQKPITRNGTTSYQTVVTDQFGVSGVVSDFESDARYKLVIENEDGETREYGSYTASIAEEVIIEVGDVVFDDLQGSEAYQWGAAYDSGDDGEQDTVRFRWQDPQDQTDSVWVQIHERGNESNVLYEDTHIGTYGNLTITEPVPEAQQNSTWVVNWEADRDGATHDGSQIIGTDIVETLPSLGDGWQTFVAATMMVIVGGAMGAVAAGPAAVVVSLLGGMFYYIGWLPVEVAGIMVLVALMVGVLYTMRGARI